MLRLAVTLGLLAVLCAAAPNKAPRLIWEDNFDWLDEGKWRHLVTAWRGGNNEFQYYRNNRKNSWADGSTLKIRPTPVIEELSDSDIRYGYIYDPSCNMEPCYSQSGQDAVQPIFSARMHTQGTFSVQYGRVEVRAKMPRGDWLWPAIWMLPDGDTYGGWPRSGEIDIVESRGNRDYHGSWGGSVGVDLAQSTLHWGPDEGQNRFMMTHWERLGPDYSDDFHTYEVEWTPDHILFRIDGGEIGSVWPPGGGFWELGGFGGGNLWGGGGKMAPFDRPFYLILNVAVGGGFFGDDLINAGGRPWDWNSGHPLLDFYEGTGRWQPTWDRPQMEVDYVRVFEL